MLALSLSSGTTFFCYKVKMDHKSINYHKIYFPHFIQNNRVYLGKRTNIKVVAMNAVMFSS